MESLTCAGIKIDEIESALTYLEVQVHADASGEGRAAATDGATGGSGGNQGAEASAIAVVCSCLFVCLYIFTCLFLQEDFVVICLCFDLCSWTGV